MACFLISSSSAAQELGFTMRWKKSCSSVHPSPDLNFCKVRSLQAKCTKCWVHNGRFGTLSPSAGVGRC
uniref:Uncharacterized protein n=1 Tax=Aegilops tauschii subsp. strangulata TaxID=200361 RepID=A0A453JL98_AEGTS